MVIINFILIIKIRVPILLQTTAVATTTTTAATTTLKKTTTLNRWTHFGEVLKSTMWNFWRQCYPNILSKCAVWLLVLLSGVLVSKFDY